MRGKTITSLEQLDAEMTGKPPKKAVVAKNGHSKAKKADKKVKAEPVEKLAFRAHTMVYDEKAKTYGKKATQEFDDLDDVLTFARKQIEHGQGNGLHELAIHVR